MTSAALYGKSLYDLAKAEQQETEIMQGFENVSLIFGENEDYIRLLSEPSIAKDKRLTLLSEAFQDSIPTYLLNFLMILIEKGLLLRYKDCFHTYQSLYNEDQGISIAKVTSAVALTEEQKEALAKVLEKKTGKKITVVERIDAEVLGGLRVEVDGKTFDGTVESRLSEMRKQIQSIKI